MIDLVTRPRASNGSNASGARVKRPVVCDSIAHSRVASRVMASMVTSVATRGCARRMGARRGHRGVRARDAGDVRARARGSMREGVDGYGRRRGRAMERPEEEEDCDVYTVRYGDTLVGVARTHGTSVDAICEANGVRLASEDETPALFVGQRLLIPREEMETRDYGYGDGRGTATTRRATALSAKERDAEYERARRVRSERKRATAPATQTHEVVSRSAVETLTRDEVAGLLTHRDETVMLLVETSNCRWCDDVQPAWTAMGVCYENDPTVRVCRLRCESDELKQFAAKYFRAKTFPTIVALPAGKGPVYRHASADRSVAALLEFAEEATGRASPTFDVDYRKPVDANIVASSDGGGGFARDDVRASYSNHPLAPRTKTNPIHKLTDVIGNAIGVSETRASVGASANVNLLPVAAVGLVAAATFAALANVVMTVKSVGRDERVHTRRLGRHFHEEEFADEHEPLDDYDEALIEVSNQDDPDELAEWRSLVLEELFSLPSRAMLLIRIWLLIGRRAFELRGRRRGRNERRSRRRADDYEDDGDFDRGY